MTDSERRTSVRRASTTRNFKSYFVTHVGHGLTDRRAEIHWPVSTHARPATSRCLTTLTAQFEVRSSFDSALLAPFVIDRISCDSELST